MANEEIKKLVIARIASMPESMKISIGAYGSFDKYELIDRIKEGDEIGKKVVEIQMSYLRSMKKGFE